MEIKRQNNNQDWRLKIPALLSHLYVSIERKERLSIIDRGEIFWQEAIICLFGTEPNKCQ